MLRRLKRTIKENLRYYVEQEARQTAGDVELARQRNATLQSADFADKYMKMARSYPDKFALLKASIQRIEIPGLYCEFGVYRGETINFIASLTREQVHGFDSFEGLPEDWRSGHEKGKFAVRSLPEVGANVRLYKGWFEDTLPDFRKKYSEPIAFLHFDADLYSSTKTVFELLGDRIVPGTVFQFDEFFNYPGWQEGEYKAFCEFCALRNAEVQYIGFTRYDEQVAAKVAKIAASVGFSPVTSISSASA